MLTYVDWAVHDEESRVTLMLTMAPEGLVAESQSVKRRNYFPTRNYHDDTAQYFYAYTATAMEFSGRQREQFDKKIIIIIIDNNNRK